MMCNSATTLLRDCEVCAVTATPHIKNAPPPPLLQQLPIVPFPLGRFNARALRAPLWFVLRDCEVCEVSYIPRQENRRKCIYIGWSGAGLANLAVPPTLRTRVGGPPWPSATRVHSSSLLRQAAALSHRQQTGPRHAQTLADDGLDPDDLDDPGFDDLDDPGYNDLDLEELNEGAMDWVAPRILVDEGGRGNAPAEPEQSTAPSHTTKGTAS